MQKISQIIWIVLVAISSSTVWAAPQAQPGDVALRHDIQVLADYGAISGPVTTWPISWDAVLADLEEIQANNVVLPNKVLPTFDRILSRALRETKRGEFTYGASLAGAEDPANIRGFSNTPRERGEIRAGASWFSKYFSLDLNASVVDQPSDNEDVRVDGSQIGVDLGNWSIAASTMDRWWGPGWDGSLILSNNARPIPSLTIGRNKTHAFETKWLSWIGPWDMNVIFGQLEQERAVPNAQFLGMRINFRPLDSLEIGISRTAQWCGDGRPCGFDIFTDLLLGKDNIGDAGTTVENEPGNQMAGFDVRWTNMWLGTPISFYGQMIGEDEAGGFPSRYLAQFGVELTGITRGQYSYRFFAEVAGTSCDVVKGTVLYGCGYRQGIYQSGYTYEGRIIGHGLDNDARVLSAGVMVVSSEGNTWHVLGRLGDLNRVGTDPDHSVAVVPQEMASIDIQHSRYTKIGRFDIGIGFERREIMATGVNTRDGRGFIRWTSP
jgi:hypothetical protein